MQSPHHSSDLLSQHERYWVTLLQATLREGFSSPSKREVLTNSTEVVSLESKGCSVSCHPPKLLYTNNQGIPVKWSTLRTAITPTALLLPAFSYEENWKQKTPSYPLKEKYIDNSWQPLTFLPWFYAFPEKTFILHTAHLEMKIITLHITSLFQPSNLQPALSSPEHSACECAPVASHKKVKNSNSLKLHSLQSSSSYSQAMHNLKIRKLKHENSWMFFSGPITPMPSLKPWAQITVHKPN